MQSEGGEVSAVGNEAAAKNSEDPSAEAEESLERGEEEADENAERRDIVKMSDPREPSENERRERNEGSRPPFRSWRARWYQRTRPRSGSPQIQRAVSGPP